MDLFEEILYLAGCYDERIDENVGGIKKRNAPSMSPEEFRQVISYDPILCQYLDLSDAELSNKPNSYLQWLVIHWDDVKNNSADDIKNLLNEFKILCNRNKITNKDINSYRSVKDLIDEVEEAKNKADSLSQKQNKARRESKYADKDIKLLCSGDIFNMYQPLSYASSVKLGKGTNWCTATNSDDSYYNEYSDLGPLFIFINKEDSKEKYQLWYSKNEKEEISIDGTHTLRDKTNILKQPLEFILADKKIYDYLHSNPNIALYLKKYWKKEMSISYSKLKNFNMYSFECFLNRTNIKYKKYKNKIYVDDDLNLYDTKIQKLPNELEVNGYLYMPLTSIIQFPEKLKVHKYLDITSSKISKLPNNLYVGEDLKLYNSTIKEFSEKIQVGGILNLRNASITKLPNNLIVGENLILRDTKINELPHNLSVGGNLCLENTYVTKLPEDLQVGKSILVNEEKEEEMKKLNPKFANKICS